MLKSRGPEGRLPLASSNLFFLGLLFIVALVAAIYGASLRTTEAAAEAASGRGTDAVPASTSQSNFALQFDGVDDYARVLDSGNFDFDTTFTIEAWVKPDSVSGPIQFNGLVSGRVDDRPDSSGGWIMFQPKDDHSQWGMSVCTPNCGAATVQPG
ncbi:MAG: hypothetical protein PVJ75_12770, partial [Chloroflexota bacterium]